VKCGRRVHEISQWVRADRAGEGDTRCAWERSQGKIFDLEQMGEAAAFSGDELIRTTLQPFPLFVESALLFVMPHFLTVSRIHLTEKCSSAIAAPPKPERRA
jgi:hypothetical protein